MAEANPAGTGAPAPQPQVAEIPPPAQPVAPPATGPRVADLPEEALAKRLERERETAQRELLKQLGVTDVKSATDALADLKKRQDAERTETERLKLENDALRQKALRADAQEPVIKARADAEMAALNDVQRAAVQRLAGDDPAATLRTITELRVGGLLPAVGAQPAATAGAQAQVSQPGSTAAPPPPAPPPGGAPTPNHLATYLELEKQNPVAAANYYVRHATAIQAAQQSRS